jgi:hypothetical protein
MKKAEERRVNEALADALERMSQGESLESCLEGYPDIKDELRVLLETAQMLEGAFSIEVEEETRQRVWSKVEGSLRERARPRTSVWLPRWAFALGAVVVVIGSLVGFSTSSLPGTLLYPVKMATEEVRLAFAFSPEAKLKLEAELVDRRIEEIATLAQKGDVSGVKIAEERLGKSFSRMASLSEAVLVASPEKSSPITSTVTMPNGGRPATSAQLSGDNTPQGGVTTSSGASDILNSKSDLVASLSELSYKGEQVLLEEIDKAPEDVRPALEEALNSFRAGYQEVLAGLEQPSGFY